MREEHLAIIREACIKANPEIVELKFGCELLRPDTPRTYVVIEDMTWGGNKKEIWINSVPFGSMHLPVRMNKEDVRNGIPDYNGDVWQVIGRSIHLADVLLAMRQVDRPIAVDDDGAIWDWQNKDWHGNGSLNYNLAKDDLTQQSDECLSFLAELLKEKEA